MKQDDVEYFRGRGGCQVQRAAEPALCILREKGPFLSPPLVCGL